MLQEATNETCIKEAYHPTIFRNLKFLEATSSTILKIKKWNFCSLTIPYIINILQKRLWKCNHYWIHKKYVYVTITRYRKQLQAKV